MVEDGLDATVLVQAKITRLETSEKLSDAALADLQLEADGRPDAGALSAKLEADAS